MQQVELENPPGQKLPKWQRSFCVSDDGRVFMPAAIGGNERNVILCAAYDGTPSVMMHKHVYLPTDWMAKEYPAIAEVSALIERKAKEILASDRHAP